MIRCRLAGAAENTNRALRLTMFLTFAHVSAWALHVASYAVVSARSSMGTYHALEFSALYVLGCSAAAVLAVWLWQKIRASEAAGASDRLEEILGNPILVAVFCLLSVIGLSLHYYDKLIINQFSGACLADLRTAWVTTTVARGRTLSSWQSALGHILSHAAFPLLFALFVARHRLPRWLRITGWSVAVPSTLLYAAIIGTRTTILSFVACAVLAFGVCLCFARREDALREVKRALSPLALILMAALIYAIAIFADRMYCYGGSEVYVGQFVPELSAETAGKLPETDMGSLAALFGLYLTHSSWTFEKSLEAPHRSGYVFLNFAWYWLFRLGMIDVMPQGERPYEHGMMSLPGAAWYDFGLAGMITVSVLHGILIAVAGVLLTTKGFPQAVGMFTYVCIGLITLWSPLAFALNTLSFPFIGLAFLVYVFSAWAVFATGWRAQRQPLRVASDRRER